MDHKDRCRNYLRGCQDMCVRESGVMVQERNQDSAHAGMLALPHSLEMGTGLNSLELGSDNIVD